MRRQEGSFGMSCKGCKKNRSASPLLLKFSGLTPQFPNGGDTTTFIADQGGFGAAPLQIPVAYPLPRCAEIERLSASILAGVGLGPQTTATLRVFRDGVPVPDLDVVFGGTNPVSGVQSRVAAVPVVFEVGQRLDVAILTSGGAIPIGIAASVMLAGRFAP